jgi:hypothetical protein
MEGGRNQHRIMLKDGFGIGGVEPSSCATIISVHLHTLCCPNWTKFHFSL